MKIVSLSASKDGLDILYDVMASHGAFSPFEAIITLSDKSKTVMYDGVDREEWYKWKHRVPVYEIEDINTDGRITLKILNPDIVLVVGWRQIIDKELLDEYTFVGLHPTLLPYGRGQAPIINTILEGLKESGVTMYIMDGGVDTGPIIAQSKFDIEDYEYAEQVYDSIIHEEIILVTKLIDGEITIDDAKPQDESKATYYTAPESNEIDLNDDPEYILRKIRALSEPYQGAYIKLGDKKLRIWGATLE